jgi:hypothetical protein
MRFILISLFASLILGMTTTKHRYQRLGKDFALFFPVSDYSHSNLTNLKQAIPNAESIAHELESSFGFKPEIVPNATYDQIEAKLEEYDRKFIDGRLPADGQLFIYFSGHGMREFSNGYFLPADANPNSLPRTALGYNYWRQFISNINCQHILVAVDACYSVTFDPDHTFANFEKFRRKGELTETERILANHEEFNSRIFFSSDSKEDIVPGSSNFARKLLEGLQNLRSPNGFITSSQLFSNYVELAQPSPRAADFEGDEPSATFLFFHPVSSVGTNFPLKGPRGVTKSTIIDRQGFTYKTVSFPDGKSWLAENLSLPSNLDFCYEDKDINCNRFGRYYTFKAARKMCPKGWHLPSYKDWEIVLEQDSTNELNIGYYGYCQRPKLLDEKGTTAHVGFNQTAAFWTSDIDDIYNSVLLTKSPENRGISISNRMTDRKKYALQCRCIKD